MSERPEGSREVTKKSRPRLSRRSGGQKFDEVKGSVTQNWDRNELLVLYGERFYGSVHRITVCIQDSLRSNPLKQ